MKIKELTKIMKTKLLIAWALLMGTGVFAQIQGDGGLPKSNKSSNHFIIPTIHFGEPNIPLLKQEDSLVDAQKAGPWRFGFNNETNLTLENSGSWLNLSNGGKIWRLKMVCENALTINLTLDNVVIPEGNELYIYNEDKSFILGKFTSNHLYEGVLGAELIPGGVAIAEYYVAPNNTNEISSLRINTVTHGYRTANEFQEKAFGSSGSCNMNVNCPDGTPWEAHKRGAVMLVSGSNGFCSGSMINNTQNDGKPYVLTANHCYSNPASWIFRFHWESATCANPGASPTFMSLNGGVLRSRRTPSDFCLVEITGGLVGGTVPTSYNTYFPGWDNSGTNPTATICIHHPAGDIKKISFDDAAASPIQAMGSSEANSSWAVEWDRNTTTEGGSSGSPLYDQNGRIIGQLWGGGASCSNLSAPDYYGRVSNSWQPSGSNSTNQLKFWLDPTNLGVTVIDGFDPNNPPAPDNAGINSVTSPVGSSCSDEFIPSVVLRNYGNNALTSVTINYNVDGGTNNTFPWTGNLAPNTNTTVTLPSMTVAAGNHTFNSFTTLPNGVADTGTSNDASSSSFTTSTGGQAININVTTDCWGEETYWELRDAGNVLIADGGNQELVLPGGAGNAADGDLGAYGDQLTIVTTVCLPDGCYDFTIYDDFGDGLLGTSSGCSTNGNYTITDASATVLASLTTVNFGDNETNNFCLGAIVPCSDPLVVTLTGSTPEINGNDGTINISIAGGGAPFVYTWTGSDGFTGNTEDLSGLPAGTYSITVTDDCSNSETITGINIQDATSIDEASTNAFMVYPNPNNGTFTIQVQNINSTTKASVTDLFGRIIYTQELTTDTTQISIENLAKGTYMLNLTSDTFNKTVSVMITK